MVSINEKDLPREATQNELWSLNICGFCFYFNEVKNEEGEIEPFCEFFEHTPNWKETCKFFQNRKEVI